MPQLNKLRVSGTFRLFILNGLADDFFGFEEIFDLDFGVFEGI